MAQKVTAKHVRHEWTTEDLPARTGATPRAQGFVFSGGTLSGRRRLYNYTELIEAPVSVADTYRAVNVVGAADEFAHQMELATKTLAQWIENEIWTQSGEYPASLPVTGGSATASQLAGVLSFLNTTFLGAAADANVSTSAATRAVSTSIMNGVLANIRTNGGNPDCIFTSPSRRLNLKNLIATGYGDRQVPARDGGAIVQFVSVYQNDFGSQFIYDSLDIPTDSYAILEMGRWAVAWLQKPQMKKVGRRGDKTEAYMVAEFTIECRAPEHNGRVSQIGDG